MSGCIAIDYEPRPGALASIMTLVKLEGFTMINIRMIPCADGKRETLTLNLDVEARSDWLELESRLRQLDGVLDVIHCSKLTEARDSASENQLESSHFRASSVLSNT